MLDNPIRWDIDADVGYIEDNESDVELVAGELQIINETINLRIPNI